MRHFLLATILSFFLAATANAQTTVRKYDLDTIDSSIKCELSRVARSYGPQRKGGPAMLAFVTVTGTETISKKVGFNLFFGATYETTTVRVRGMEAKRNIHGKNRVNCGKSFVVDVGVYDCLVKGKTQFFQGQTLVCSDNSSASAEISGGLTTTWIVQAKVEGNLVSKREWKIDVVAPPRGG